MKQSKKILMVLMLIASLGSAAFSWNSVSAATIRSINTRTANVGITIENGVAKCKALVTCSKNTRLSGTMKLVKVNGTKQDLVEQWNLKSDSSNLACTKTARVTKGEYKLILSVTAVNGSDHETITKTDSTVY